MKVQASIKKRCPNCRLAIRMNGEGKKTRRIVCVNPRHKQRQG